MGEDGVEVVGDLTLIKLKQLILWSIEKVDESILTDDFLKDIRKRNKNSEWQNAMQVIGAELAPAKKFTKGEDKLSVVHIATIDDGFKDNVTHHYCINGDRALTIKDRGVRDLNFGDVVAIDCVTSTDEDTERVYYDVKKDTSPKVARTLTKQETFEKMKSVVKNVWDLEHGEVAVVEVRMTHSIRVMKDNKTQEELPTWVMTDKEIGFQVMASAYQRKDEEKEDSEAEYITLFIRPQRYGGQIYTGLIPENFADDVMKYVVPEDYLDRIINMFVPRPSHLKVLSMGRVRVDSREGKYKGSKSFSPCVGIMLDVKSQTPDFLLAEDEPEPEPEEPEPEPEDEDKPLEDADLKMVKKYMKYNKTISLEKLNEMFGKKGYVCSEKIFKKVKKELGVL